MIYGIGVGPGLVHLPEEFKVSEARKNTRTWIKRAKWRERYFYCIEEAIKLLLNYLFFMRPYTRPTSSITDQRLFLTIQDTPKLGDLWLENETTLECVHIILCRVVPDGQSVNGAEM